jgi:hypothetical protein
MNGGPESYEPFMYISALFTEESWHSVDTSEAYHEELIGDYQAFLDRIEVQNNANPTPTINKQTFVGSIGAVDGTYSVVCRIREAAQDIDEDGLTLDRMYTSYKTCHAYKLVLTTTHLSKFIIALDIAPGSSSDATLYNTMVVSYLMENLHQGAVLMGDNAFHSSFLVITPFPTNTNVYSHQALVQAMSTFNHNHSKDRMASKHVKFMGAECIEPSDEQVC